MKFKFLPSSINDLAWMQQYYRTVFPEGAEHANQQYQATKQVLKSNPHIGRPVESYPGLREFPVLKTPFSFIYRVTVTHIEVVHVWDQRRDRSSMKGPEL